MSVISPRTIPALAAGLALSLTGCLDGGDGEVVLVDSDLPDEVRLDGPAPWFGAVEYGAGWDKDDLDVCWDASAFGTTSDEERVFEQSREWIRRIVLDEWGRAGRIRFNDWWFRCDALSYTPDIRIGHVGGSGGWSSFGTDAREIASGPTMAVNLYGPSGGGCIQTGGVGGGGGGGVIAACNGTWVVTDPDSMQTWQESYALHLFGYALGLRKEDTHPQNTCFHSEAPDGYGHDGEPLWSFDPTSIMSSCQLSWVAYHSTARPALSPKDIRSLDTVYPTGVRLSTAAQLAGTASWYGPGYYTRATTPALADIGSLLVPPGYRVTVCTTTNCYLYTESRRAMPASLKTSIQNMSIGLVSTVAADIGYLGNQQSLTPGTYRAASGQLATVGNNAISSAFMPPGHGITLCDVDPGTGPNSCLSSVGGIMGWPTLVKIFAIIGTSLDNRTSYVKVQPRVVTYSSSELRGVSYSVGTGTYKVSSGSTYLSGVRALSVPPGLDAVVCNRESTAPFPRPICQTFTQSGPVQANLIGQIKRLEVRVPLVIAQR